MAYRILQKGIARSRTRTSFDALLRVNEITGPNQEPAYWAIISIESTLISLDKPGLLSHLAYQSKVLSTPGCTFTSVSSSHSRNSNTERGSPQGENRCAIEGEQIQRATEDSLHPLRPFIFKFNPGYARLDAPTFTGRIQSQSRFSQARLLFIKVGRGIAGSKSIIAPTCSGRNRDATQPQSCENFKHRIVRRITYASAVVREDPALAREPRLRLPFEAQLEALPRHTQHREVKSRPRTSICPLFLLSRFISDGHQSRWSVNITWRSNNALWIQGSNLKHLFYRHFPRCQRAFGLWH